jgi:hypothetical protein
MEIIHPQAKRKVNASDLVTIHFTCHELALGKDLPVIVEFFNGVGRLRWVDELAKRNNGVIVRWGEVANLIIGREHRNHSDSRRPTNQAIAMCFGDQVRR